MKRMRVISGIYRSRRLAAPDGLATRPTGDRVRETLFNILAPRIAGATFADLFAGSGANGIEAISRGAGMVFFVENAPPALEALRLNLKSLGIVSGFGLEPRSVSSFLRRLAQRERRLDIVFLDPPYDALPEYAVTLDLLGGECSSLLDRESIVVAEHRRKQPLAEQYGELVRYRVREQGDTALSFFQRKKMDIEESSSPI
ncbi:16S rRNA (guanine(966)-N(2))-methyltransferase [Acidisarcina polymorpha]|uniref:16S rRNA (Guanine(966)-N(2))-methyltransferase n=1 Tax=Acidisarcina polymorpha TaxID=2211140 RepID=A0A2Z5FWL0_9BACT|nr:16S rRNA (guanine(966)-N(2))-methyltransferase [Acidisarcina polymorpha]